MRERRVALLLELQRAHERRQLVDLLSMMISKRKEPLVLPMLLEDVNQDATVVGCKPAALAAIKGLKVLKEPFHKITLQTFDRQVPPTITLSQHRAKSPPPSPRCII